MNEELNPHPHADLLRAIADGKQMEQLAEFDWLKCTPKIALSRLASGQSIRIAPDVIIINGHEVPRPMSIAPEKGNGYWWVKLDSPSEPAWRFAWVGDCLDKTLLVRGLCHLTREAALAHANALLSFTSEK